MIYGPEAFNWSDQMYVEVVGTHGGRPCRVRAPLRVPAYFEVSLVYIATFKGTLHYLNASYQFIFIKFFQFPFRQTLLALRRWKQNQHHVPDRPNCQRMFCPGYCRDSLSPQ